MATRYVLAIQVLASQNPQAPVGLKAASLIARFPRVVGKWQKEARELKGRQMDLKRTHKD